MSRRINGTADRASAPPHQKDTPAVATAASGARAAETLRRALPYLPRPLQLGLRLLWWTASGQLRTGWEKYRAASLGLNYRAWIDRYDTLTDADRQAVGERIERLADPPLISIVMPVYETPEPYLRAAIESVRAQLYPHWELCIADDASRSPHIRAVLDGYAASDGRIKICYRPANGHISAASNSALSLASGSFVALLDHDDALPEHALYMVAETLLAHPDTDLIFTDEDKIRPDGTRFDPYFKPNWNLDLMLSQNVFCHLGVFRRRLLEEIGGFREGYDGSQDYDLVLRAAARSRPERIRHIPHILYHWRAIPGSAATAPGEKDYAVGRARQAITDFLAAQGSAAEVTAAAQPHYHRVRYGLPDPPRVSVLVPTRDQSDLLRTCVAGLLNNTDYPDIEIIVVDNQSREPKTAAYFRELAAEPRVRVLPYAKPFNYAAINNFAAAEATGSILCLLNNDIEVIHPDWLREMVSHAVRPGIGAVGAMLYYPDDRIQHAGTIIGMGGVAGHAYCRVPRGAEGYFGRAAVVQNLSAVTAACLVLPAAVFRAVGGLDEANLAVAFNDVDFCLRIVEQGYRIVWTPHAELYHHESASRGADTDRKKRARFAREVEYMMERWGGLLGHDPCYNPNLSLDYHSPRLAAPPRIEKLAIE